MKVLVLCEESQAVTKAFRSRGFECYSCDLQECSGGHPEWHLQMDAFEAIDIIKPTLAIFHPPCTFLSRAGARWMYPTAGNIDPDRLKLAMEAKEFFMRCLNADIPYIAVENPLPLKIVGLPSETQVIQPYEYGDPFSKRTHLWLRGLPSLKPTNVLSDYVPFLPSNTGGAKRGQVARPKSISKKESSKTFPGIADAMADQWGIVLKNNKMIKVFSGFDGISCGLVALERAGIGVSRYVASEINKFAEKISQRNYPSIERVGDIEKYEITEHFDLVIGGSPCQGFSKGGKGLNFEDPRSKLFWVWVKRLREAQRINPEVKFLLENVNMKKEWQDIISEELKVEPLRINSSLVSAQMRDRLYWTNIHATQNSLFGDHMVSLIPQPSDLSILLPSILEYETDKKYLLSEKLMNRLQRRSAKTNGFSNPKIDPLKTGTITTRNNSGRMSIDSGTTMIGCRVMNDRLVLCDKSSCLTANYTKNIDTHGAHTFVMEQSENGDKKYRRLTPTECERLQCLPDGYTEGVSDTRRYEALENGWNVDTIVHILKHYGR